MAKLIKLTPDIIDSVREQITKSLLAIKLSDGKLTYSQSFSDINRRATIFFSEIAWAKMVSLIYTCDKEVAWHGLARRGPDETVDEYYIYDILVYPQEVTGGSVTTDQERYQTWLYDRSDDEFNDIRMQGHSHVNMSTTPSSVDTTFYDRILDQLSGDMFYIFMIWNKRQEKTIKLYDMKKNILFETKDCDVRLIDSDIGIRKFLADANNMVKERSYTASNYSSNSKTGSSTIKPDETKKIEKVADNTKPAENNKEAKQEMNDSKRSNVSDYRKGKRRQHKSNKYSYTPWWNERIDDDTDW